MQAGGVFRCLSGLSCFLIKCIILIFYFISSVVLHVESSDFVSYGAILRCIIL